MKNNGIKSKRLVGLFLLGCLLSNYPIISLFNLKRLFLGFPLLHLYMFTIWAGMVLLIFWITRSPRHDSQAETLPGPDQPLP